MERFIKDYDVYNYFRIGSTDIITFDAHNMALPLWGAMSSILGASLNLVSFDCHTDTHKPFAAKVCSGDPDGMRGYYSDHPIIREILSGKKYQMNNFSFDSVYSIADNSLKNDEHILTAVNFGYIREYTIVCNIEPRYVDQFIRADSFDGYKAVYISKESLPIHIDVASPIVLDIDLDYFNSKEDLSDSFIDTVAPIIKRAELITIAREPSFFEYCRTDNNFSIEDAYNSIINIITDYVIK